MSFIFVPISHLGAVWDRVFQFCEGQQFFLMIPSSKKKKNYIIFSIASFSIYKQVKPP